MKLCLIKKTVMIIYYFFALIKQNRLYGIKAHENSINGTLKKIKKESFNIRSMLFEIQDKNKTNSNMMQKYDKTIKKLIEYCLIAKKIKIQFDVNNLHIVLYRLNKAVESINRGILYQECSKEKLLKPLNDNEVADFANFLLETGRIHYQKLGIKDVGISIYQNGCMDSLEIRIIKLIIHLDLANFNKTEGFKHDYREYGRDLRSIVGNYIIYGKNNLELGFRIIRILFFTCFYIDNLYLNYEIALNHNKSLNKLQLNFFLKMLTIICKSCEEYKTVFFKLFKKFTPKNTNLFAKYLFLHIDEVLDYKSDEESPNKLLAYAIIKKNIFKNMIKAIRIFLKTHICEKEVINIYTICDNFFVNYNKIIKKEENIKIKGILQKYANIFLKNFEILVLNHQRTRKNIHIETLQYINFSHFTFDAQIIFFTILKFNMLLLMDEHIV